ncbi:hypothetical protein LXA43DRAFT_475213 [Ganoderma leucocontextum]|nr:hypothetical protein LXA43DRAFT_475213 [Ganoderma leucocontextum]
MAQGKGKATQQDSDDEQPLTHTLDDLEQAGSNHAPRYTAGQITERTIVLVDRDHTRNPTAQPTACRYCLETAINRGPCPHGTFPVDSRPRPALPYHTRPEAPPREPEVGGGRHSPASDDSAELWDAAPQPGRSTPYPPYSPPPQHSCPWGHHHSTKEKASRCVSRTSTLSSSSSSSSSTATPANTGAARVAVTSIDQSPSRPSPARSGGASASGPSRVDSQTQTSTRSAAPRLRTTGYDWFRMHQSAPRSGAETVAEYRPQPNPTHPSAVPTPSPAAPTTPVPAGPAYVAHIDRYDPSVSVWYVVTVGSRVGVFSQQ